MSSNDPLNVQGEPPGDWALRGACRTSKVDFFAEHGAYQSAAKLVCRTCEVMPECRNYALPRAWLHGVWGGLSKPERSRMAKDMDLIRATRGGGVWY